MKNNDSDLQLLYMFNKQFGLSVIILPVDWPYFTCDLTYRPDFTCELTTFLLIKLILPVNWHLTCRLTWFSLWVDTVIPVYRPDYIFELTIYL